MTHGLGSGLPYKGDGGAFGNFEENLKVLFSAHGLKCFLLIF